MTFMCVTVNSCFMTTAVWSDSSRALNTFIPQSSPSLSPSTCLDTRKTHNTRLTVDIIAQEG